MTTYSANVAIFMNSNFSITRLVGTTYPTLAAAQAAANAEAQNIQNQALATGILQAVPVFIMIDPNDGHNMPVRVRTGNIFAIWPSANDT